jgi:miniconductance mechanosensitive channel
MPALHDLLHHPWIHTLIGALVLLAAACLIGAVTRFVLVRAARGLGRRTAWKWGDALFAHGAFKWLAWMVPTVVVQYGVAWVPGISPGDGQLIGKLAMALVVFFLAMALSAAMSAAEDLYRQTPQGGQRSLKGLVQLVKLVLFIVTALVIIASVTGKQVGLLLSGLGAMSAVLLLIFKDTILGFVAGVQLASNDMLRVGDWITMSGAGADGNVMEITLYTVKVRNFDNTIVTVPTWKLIAESYQNWRGMVESGGRRIKRALYLDASSVRFLDQDDLARCAQLPLLHDDLEGWRGDAAHGNGAPAAAGAPADRRRPTNLGAFRAYVLAYLKSNPDIHPRMSCMVRQLANGPQGIPLELYCFTNTTAWEKYEGIQSDIFEHLYALLPMFGLRLYQLPSGYDTRTALAPPGVGQAESPLPHPPGQ